MRRCSLASLVAAAVIAAGPAAGADSTRIEHGWVASFDGTRIAYSLMTPESASAERPVPVVLNSHGWGGRRQRDAGGFLGRLLSEGYAVLTWDARGFGESGGEANVNAQEFEVRDVRALIDFVAARDEIQRDASADPRMGMFGSSYGGGIQLMTAAVDDRIDAIAPQIAWNDLPQSLKPGGVLKLGWGTVLYAGGLPGATAEGARAGERGSYAEQIHRAYAQSTTLNDWSEDIYEWFDARSPKHYVDGVRAPTLVIQGTNDTLFPVNEGVANYRQIGRSGVATKLLLYCGGHTANASGTSCAAADSARRIDERVLAWLDAYVRDPLGDAPTGAEIEYQLQDGSFRTTDALPRPSVRARGSGRLVNTVAPTSGAGTAATPAPDGIRVPIPVEAGRTILGIPRATLTVTGTGPEASLFLKLIDVAPDGGEKVIDDQAMAQKVVDLSSAAQRVTLDLTGVAWLVQEGHRIELEISATSNDHNSTRTPFVAEVGVVVEVPVVGAAAARDDGTAVLGGTRQAARALPATGLSRFDWTGPSLVLSATLLARWTVGRRKGARPSA